MLSDEDLENRFKFHAPKEPKTVMTHEAVRNMCHNLAKYICRETPVSREQSVAITKLEEVMFWANAAIARNQ